MYKSRHATASAVGPIVTKIEIWSGMSSVVKAPLHYRTKYRCSPMYQTARILDTNLHKKYYKEPP